MKKKTKANKVPRATKGRSTKRRAKPGLTCEELAELAKRAAKRRGRLKLNMPLKFLREAQRLADDGVWGIFS